GRPTRLGAGWAVRDARSDHLPGRALTSARMHSSTALLPIAATRLTGAVALILASGPRLPGSTRRPAARLLGSIGLGVLRARPRCSRARAKPRETVERLLQLL